MNKNNNQFLVFALLSVILILSISFVSAISLPANPTAPTLGEAGRFVILASQKVTTTGTSASAVTGGNIGIEDQARSYYEGFTAGANPGQFTELTDGLSYAHDDTDSSLNGGYPSTIAFIDQIRTDLGNAYTFLGADPNPTAPTQVSPTELGTLTLTRGVYKTGSNVGITTGPLYLDAQGDPNSVFIFSIGGTLTIGAPSGDIILMNGAQAKNVYFVIGGKTTIEAGRSAYGNIFSFQQINLLDSATITGRLYSVNEQVTLISNAVTAPPVSALTLITISPTSANLTVNSTLQLNASSFDQFNATMDVNITYTSSNLSSVYVNETTGLVNAVAVGNATITATNGNITDSILIIVSSNSTQFILERIVLFPSQSTMNIGSILNLNATGFDQFNNTLATNISFVSSNSSAATVNETSGVVVAVYTGSAVITAFNGNVSATNTITVNAPTIPPVLTIINFSEISANITIGNNLQLNVSSFDQYGYSISSVINYSSSNTSIANVNETTGLVNAVAVGNATITATSGNLSTTTIVYVETAPVIVTPTPSSTSSNDDDSSSGGGSGGSRTSCSTQWVCSGYSVCSNGVQTRSCSYPTTSCIPEFVKPVETQSCTSTISGTENNPTDDAGSAGAGITGGVIGTSDKNRAGTIVLIVILLALGIGALVFVLLKPV